MDREPDYDDRVVVVGSAIIFVLITHLQDSMLEEDFNPLLSALLWGVGTAIYFLVRNLIREIRRPRDEA